MTAVETRADGVRIRVRVTPRADRDAIVGWRETTAGLALDVRVRAVPDGGRANAAVLALLADGLDVPSRAVTLETGSASRIKIMSIQGAPDRLRARLNQFGA